MSKVKKVTVVTKEEKNKMVNDLNEAIKHEKKKLQVKELHLKMPIKIRQNLTKDGFVIIDKSGSEFFFYEEKKGSHKMIYDGCAINVK